MKKILISGASIAGPTLAYWLSTFDCDVTVVERSEHLRLGGQNIDIKGAAKDVAVRMGIFDQIQNATTGEKGTRYVDQDNNIKAEFEKGAFGGLTSELEILRGDLVQILYDCTRERVQYEFGDAIKSLRQQDDGIDVTFESGKTGRYDVVVGADGQRSHTRDLVFGDEPELKYLGLYTSYLTIPKGPTDSDWARWYFATKSRNILVRPDNKGTTRVSLNFLSPDRDYGRLPQEAQKRILATVFDDAGWESERILAAMRQSDDVFLDSVTQVRAPRWSEGRVVLVGDAAYCPTPISGKGTALAMIGAYILAHEIRAHDACADAFRAYDQKLRPYVESVQKVPAGLVKLAYPSSKLGVAVLNTVEALLASDAFQGIHDFFAGGEKAGDDDFTLPEYA